MKMREMVSDNGQSKLQKILYELGVEYVKS